MFIKIINIVMGLGIRKIGINEVRRGGSVLLPSTMALFHAPRTFPFSINNFPSISLNLFLYFYLAFDIYNT
jgi:hypothetical protein